MPFCRLAPTRCCPPSQLVRPARAVCGAARGLPRGGARHQIAPPCPGYVVATGLNLQAARKAYVDSLVTATFTWVVPFSAAVWLIIFASLLIVGCVMFHIERRYNEEDFGEYSKSRWGPALTKGMYLAVAGFVTKTSEFEPKTLAGKVSGCGRRLRALRAGCWQPPLPELRILRPPASLHPAPAGLVQQPSCLLALPAGCGLGQCLCCVPLHFLLRRKPDLADHQQ